MSLIVGMRARDGIVIASDSRGTVGDPRGLTAINDSQLKIFSVGRFGIGLAGASELGAALLDELRKVNLAGCPNIDICVQTMAQVSVNLFTQWFREIPPAARPGLLFTVAGYRVTDSQPPEAMIYMLNSQLNFAPQLFTNMPSLSGIPQYAVYLVNRYYDPSISLERAKALAEYLISETASQDPKVGGPIKMAEITPEKGYRELTEQEVAEIQQSNKELNVQLRQFFLKGKVDGSNH